jgi:tetratricopeptide (TPR) repeat protein
VQYGLAKQQYDSGNFDDSRQTVQQALSLEPHNAVLRVLSARIAIEQGQLELAERELQAARQDAPNDAEADYLTGVVYQRWEKPQTAYEFYCRAADKAPAELAYVLAKAEMLVTMNRADEALQLLQDKVVYFEHSGSIRDAVGQLLVQKQQYPQAVDMLRQASILSPDDLSIREHLGLALYYDKQYIQAADVLGKLVSDPAYANRADLLLALGECQLAQGHTRDARGSFESAARIAPGLVGIWWGLGRAALTIGDLPRADLAVRRGLSLDPQSAEGHLLLGYVLLRQNRLPEALETFRQASQLNPRDTVSLCMVGYVLEKSGHADEAMKWYAAALRAQPQDPLASRLMASVDARD